MVIWNLPNAITLTRLAATVLVFAAVARPGWEFTAAVLFVVVAATDAVDGAVARRRGEVTTFGRILDPFVDKVLVVGTLLFLLGRTSGDDGAGSGVTATMVAVITFRELFATALRAEVERAGGDFSADRIGKLKMVVQSVVIAAVLAGMTAGLFADASWRNARDAGLWGMTLLTGWSGVVYVRRGFRALARAAGPARETVSTPAEEVSGGDSASSRPAGGGPS